ncbi:MAG: lytic transglycosylase domain-containing protein [Alphaproteobacteria bacterium]
MSLDTENEWISAMTTRPPISQNPRANTNERRRPLNSFASRAGRALTAVGLFFLTSHASSAFDLRGTPWEHAARSQNVDPLMLYAVALTESGRSQGRGLVRPWPWTLNVEGRAVFAESKADAAELLAIHQGKSVDVGLLQINSRWHGHRVDRLEALLDPETNLAVGASILKDALAANPGDLTAGIGRYHSASPVRAKAYARTVLALYRHLLHQKENGGASQ